MRGRFTIIRCLCLLLVLAAPAAYADEHVRQTQEELRRRNLYFGDVDGQFSPDLAYALKRYQKRKGFSVTGTIDPQTATSLNVEVPAPASAQQISLPDEPILRSDIARQLPNVERIALERRAEENPDAVPTPPPPAEQPPSSQDITPLRVRALVENYLRDGETSDIAAQTRYFAYPVDYFVHGMKDSKFVENDVRQYVKRWPQRKYMLMEPITFLAGENEGETLIQFPIAYSVHRPNSSANGQTMNIWTVRPEGDELKIISIREQRVRPSIDRG